MKYYSFIFALFVVPLAFSQSKLTPDNFNVFGGLSYSNFLFERSDGNTGPKFNYSSGKTFGLNISYRFKTRHYLRPELMIHQAGSASLYGGNDIIWKLNYSSLNCSYLYKIIDQENNFRYAIYTGVGMGFDYLLGGTQTINKLGYDLNETDAFKKWDVRTSILIKGKYNINPSFHIGLEYRFGVGLNQIENKDSEAGQKTRNIGHIGALLFGFDF